VSRKKKWLIGIAVVGALGVAGIFIAASILAKRFEPYIKEQAENYLAKRFDSQVEIGHLSVNIPHIPALQLITKRGAGVIAEVTGQDIVLRHKGRTDIPPMFRMKRFRFSADLGRIFDPTKRVALVHLDEMEINIPPKGERPSLNKDKDDSKKQDKNNDKAATIVPAPADPDSGADKTGVLIEQVSITRSMLRILPRTKDRKPLEFDLQDIVLDSVQMSESLNYRAKLTNPRPPGQIYSKGAFGPWNADSPSDTPLSGDFDFNNADLSVFSAIAGILQSRGTFEGTLGSVQAKGEATVPDFRLKMAGNPVHLFTQYEVEVDGTNGNTILKPVRAKLNNTAFTTSGGVIKHDGDEKRTIDLDVNMPDGEMMDLLRLATKNKPFMSGRINMVSRIQIPPFSATVKEKLRLAGKFSIKNGQFLQDAIQDKVDTLSRKGQGQPKDTSIDNVFSDMSGEFNMADQEITMKNLAFTVPGSKVRLDGSFDMQSDQLDFHGALMLDAKVSQTMSGWKRWALKPVDPFFKKNGAGTYLKIKVVGTSKAPQFGLDR
jgi:hypothetical protein